MTNQQPHDAGHQARETERIYQSQRAEQQQAAQRQAAADRARIAAHYAQQHAAAQP